MRKKNDIELKEGYIYSFYYNDDDGPNHLLYFLFKNGKPNVLLYEHGSLMYALFSVGGTSFSSANKPNLKEIGKINHRLKIIFTLGLCGFVQGEGILDKLVKSIYSFLRKRS